MGNLAYEISIYSDIVNVKEIERDLIGFFRSGMPGTANADFMEIRLIFNELLINAIIHGNGQDKQKKVRVRAEILPNNEIFGMVGDEGQGFDYKAVLARAGDLSFGEGGRGVLLAYGLADRMQFNQHGSEINFYKRVT